MTTCSRANAGACFNYTFLTQKERDIETGLDYFLARYFSSTQGRFTSPDEFKGGSEEVFGNVDPHDPLFYADVAEPQSLNKYQYALNNPLRYIDPDGHQTKTADSLKKGMKSGVRGESGIRGRASGGHRGGEPFTITNTGDAVLYGIMNLAHKAVHLGDSAPTLDLPAQVNVTRQSQAAYNQALEEEMMILPMALTPMAEASAPEMNSGGVVTSGETVTDAALLGGEEAAGVSEAASAEERGLTGGRNLPKDRTVGGAAEQVKGIEAQQKATTSRGGYRISPEKSKQNLKHALKQIKSTKDVGP